MSFKNHTTCKKLLISVIILWDILYVWLVFLLGRFFLEKSFSLEFDTKNCKFCCTGHIKVFLIVTELCKAGSQDEARKECVWILQGEKGLCIQCILLHSAFRKCGDSAAVTTTTSTTTTATITTTTTITIPPLLNTTSSPALTFQRSLSQTPKNPVKFGGSNPCLIFTMGMSLRPAGSVLRYSIARVSADFCSDWEEEDRREVWGREKHWYLR